MNDSEIQTKILEEIKRTELRILDYKEQSKPISPENAIGRISRMDAINNKSITEAALRTAESRLSHLLQACDKVGTKEFGICVKCKEPIPVGRILLIPESNKCVKCAW